MLGHAVVHGIEPGEVSGAVAVLRERADGALNDRQVRTVVEAGDVADQVRLRAEVANNLAGSPQHVARILLAQTLASSTPRRARWIRAQVADRLGRLPSVLEHLQEVARIHLHRTMADVGLVRVAVVGHVLDREIEVDPREPMTLREPARAREELDVHERSISCHRTSP